MEMVFFVLYIGLAIGGGYFLPYIAGKILAYRKIPGGFIGRSSLYLAILAGVGSWAAYVHFYYPLDKGIALFFLLLLLLIAWIDWRTGYILDELTLCGFLLLVCLQAVKNLAQLPIYLLVSVFTFFFLYFLAKWSKGLGLGDAKLMAMCALLIGWPNIVLALWLATISGLLKVGMLQLHGRAVHRKLSLPFGPHLALGAYISFLYGESFFPYFFSNHSVLSTLLAHILY